MNKLRAFIHIFLNSLLSTKYYNEIVKAPLMFSFKYLFVITALAATMTTMLTTLPELPKLKTDIKAFIDTSSSLFPSDLVITVKNGQMNINSKEPVMIKAPKEWARASGDPENIAVFDPDGTLDDLATYQTIALINKSNILLTVRDYRDERTKTEVYPLKDMPDQQITRSDYDSLLADIRAVAKYIPAFITALIFVLSLAYFFAYRAVYLVFVALFLMLAGKFKSADLSFKQYYQVALHAMTFPLLVELLVRISKIHWEIPMWFLFLNMIIGLITLFDVIANSKKNSGHLTPSN